MGCASSNAASSKSRRHSSQRQPSAGMRRSKSRPNPLRLPEPAVNTYGAGDDDDHRPALDQASAVAATPIPADDDRRPAVDFSNIPALGRSTSFGASQSVSISPVLSPMLNATTHLVLTRSILRLAGLHHGDTPQDAWVCEEWVESVQRYAPHTPIAADDQEYRVETPTIHSIDTEWQNEASAAEVATRSSA